MRRKSHRAQYRRAIGEMSIPLGRIINQCPSVANMYRAINIAAGAQRGVIPAIRNIASSAAKCRV